MPFLLCAPIMARIFWSSAVAVVGGFGTRRTGLVLRRRVAGFYSAVDNPNMGVNFAYRFTYAEDQRSPLIARTCSPYGRAEDGDQSFDGAISDLLQAAVRDALIAFVAKEAQSAGIDAARRAKTTKQSYDRNALGMVVDAGKGSARSSSAVYARRKVAEIVPSSVRTSTSTTWRSKFNATSRWPTGVSLQTTRGFVWMRLRLCYPLDLRQGARPKYFEAQGVSFLAAACEVKAQEGGAE